MSDVSEFRHDTIWQDRVDLLTEENTFLKQRIEMLQRYIVDIDHSRRELARELDALRTQQRQHRHHPARTADIGDKPVSDSERFFVTLPEDEDDPPEKGVPFLH